MFNKITLIVLIALSFIAMETEGQIVRQWANSYNGSMNTTDISSERNIRRDASNNIYQAGVVNSTGTRGDIVLIKYNSAGVLQWAKIFNETGEANFWGPHLFLDGNDNPIIVCNSRGTGSVWGICAIKYNPANGDSTWVRRWYGPGNTFAIVIVAKIDAAGNIYAGGYTAPTSGIDGDAIMIKWDNNGNLQWAYRHGPGNVLDHVYDFLVDASGNVIMTGNEGISFNHGYFIKKLNSSGVLQWYGQWNPTGYIDNAYPIKMDAQGNYYTPGDYDYPLDNSRRDNALVKWSSAGTVLWTRVITGQVSPSRVYMFGRDGFHIDGGGNVLLSGHDSSNASDYDIAVRKYKPNGDLAWVSRYNGPGNGKDNSRYSVIDNFNNIYILGTSKGSGTGNDIVTIKYDSNGVQQWANRYNGTGNGDDASGTIIMDTYGNVIISGSANNTGTGNDFVLIKYNPAGVQQWIQSYNGTGNGNDAGWYINIDNSLNVSVSADLTGSGTGQDIGLLKFIQQPPFAPLPLTATAVSQTRINLNWADTNPNEAGYKIERSTNGGSSWSLKDSVLANVITYADTGLTINTTFHYRVFAYNIAGVSPLSNVASATTFTNPPVAAPNLISPANNSNGQSTTPLLDWDSLITASNYRIQISTDSLFTSPVFDTTGVIPTQVVPSNRLSNNVTYFWRVRGRNTGGEGPWSVIWRFTTSLVGVSQNGMELPKVFKLYNNFPNPFNPVTKIKFDIPSVGQKNTFGTKLIVFNVLGEQVATLVNQQMQPGRYEVSFDAAQFASGVYFYRLETDGFTDIKKMILIK